MIKVVLISITLFLFLVFFFTIASLLLQSGKISNDLKNLQPIYLSGKTLFISDLHLRKLPDSPIKVDNLDNLIIVGDFFYSPDYLLRFDNNEKEVLEKVLEKITPSSSLTVYFIYGAWHDPWLAEGEYRFKNIKFYFLGEYGSFIVNGIPVFAMHGHQIKNMACLFIV